MIVLVLREKIEKSVFFHQTVQFSSDLLDS